MRKIEANIWDVNGKRVGKSEIWLESDKKGRLSNGRVVYKLHGRWILNAPRGKVLKYSHYQTGKSDRSKDKQLGALSPGKRESATGNVYFENRKNRSDLRKRV